LVENRDGKIELLRLRESAAAVAAIADEVRLDRACPNPPHADGEIPSVRGVGPELFGEDPLGRNGAGKHDKAARLPIDAVHRPHRRDVAGLFIAAGPVAGEEMLRDGVGHHFVERRLHLPPPRRPGEFLGVPRGGDAGRLVHHHDLIVEMDDPHIVGLRWRGRGRGEHLHHLAILEPPRRVGADVAVDHHPPRPHQLLHLRPARRAGVSRGHLGTEKSRDRLAAFGGGDMMNGSGRGFHAANLPWVRGA
jgi:hypothetical protein